MLLHPDSPKTTLHITDGLINCLRQPGQLRNTAQMSMRENSPHLLSFCVP